MADLSSVDKPQTAPPAVNEKKCKADVGLDEEEDNVASFMEVSPVCNTSIQHQEACFLLGMSSYRHVCQDKLVTTNVTAACQGHYSSAS